MRRLIVCGLVAAVTAIAAPAAFGSNYIVLYKSSTIQGDAGSTIQKAGGTLVYAYPQIGVAIASSTNPSFRDNLLQNSNIANAAATDAYATQLQDPESRAGSDAAGPPQGDLPNNSYFADPFLFNCHNDPVQQAIWAAESRAILFAEQNGTTVVAAMGNESEDLAHPTTDATSPDNTTPVTRSVTNACVVIPVEVPGVIGVTADGNARQTDSQGNPIGGYLKSLYSNVGAGLAHLVAPGGDSVFGRTPEAPNGRVLSTWPPNTPCLRSVKETSSDPNEPTVVYCYLQGTSMAAPHVAGGPALIVSRFGNLSTPQ